MSDSTNVYFAIKRINEETREVYGRATQETLDRQNEVLDYAESKPLWEAWIAETLDASGGKSMGNLRAMHRADIAAGKLVRVDFNDNEKAIDVVAKVVDDDEWNKVLEGVYTGFSQGGKYVKKTTDPTIRGFGGMAAVRVVIAPKELSLVDRPCVPSATFFEVVKADGSTENRNFKGEPMKENIQAADDATKGIWEGKAMLSAIQELKSIHDYIGEGGIGDDLRGQIRELGKLSLAYIAEELGEHIGLTVEDATDIDALIGSAEGAAMDTDDDGVPVVAGKGDYPGHPFHGNQHTGGHATGAHHGASRSAHLASVRAHGKGGSVEHKAAANYHKQAAAAHAKAGNTKMAAHHKEQAKYHAETAGRFGRTGKADSVELGDATKAARNGRKAARAALCDAHKAYMDTYATGADKDDDEPATMADKSDKVESPSASPNIEDLVAAAVAKALEAFKVAPAEVEPSRRPSVRAIDKDDDAGAKKVEAFDAVKAAKEAASPGDAIRIARQNPAHFPVR